MDTVQEVNMEDVGLAEEVINREINKVQQLQLLARVLQTYRYVKAQLPQLVEEKIIVEKKVVETRNLLNELTQSFVQERDKQTRQLQESANAQKNELTKVIERLGKEIDDYEGMLIAVKAEHKVATDVKNSELGKINEVIAVRQGELDKITKEHGALVEMFKKSREFFEGVESEVLR